MFKYAKSLVVKRLKGVVSSQRGRVVLDFSLLFAVALLIFRNFFLSSDWPGGGDVLGWISRVYIFGKDFRWLYVWRPYSFGFVEQINSMDFFLMLINLVCRSGAETIKVFTFTSFLVAGFSMYAFAYRYTRKNLAALSASLVYILNQWLFTQFTEMHVDILFGYALAPLLFLLLDRALKNGRLKDLAAFSILFSICLTGFYPGSVIIYTGFLTLFLVFYVFTPTNTPDLRKRLKRSIKVLLCSGTLVFLMSSFYILPFICNVQARFYSQEFGYPIEDAIALSYRNMTDAFNLKGMEVWGYISLVDVRTEVDLQLLPVSAILFGVFLLAYCTVLFRRDRYTFFFLFSALVATFLAKGPYPPFENIFTWAWFNVPHFNVFRVASRFAMMLTLSHAFFISVLVSMVTDYISKKQGLQAQGMSSDTSLTLRSANGKKRILYVSSDLLDRIVKPLRSSLRYFCMLLLIFILSSGFLACWFFLQHGLQAYSPPANFISPYEWIAEQPGDFKIVSVTRSPGEWELTSTESDFGSSGMLTTLGWGHDIGYESSFIHDKPVLQDGGWELKSRMFVDHLRFKQVRETLTDQLLKLLGTLNYKYVVLPPYSSQEVNTFFLNQRGAVVAYNQSDSVVIENAFHSSEIFGATRHVVVIGGLRSLFSLLKIDSFHPNQTVPLFADQLDTSSFFGSVAFNDSEALLFDDSDFMDLVMLSSENMNVILASQYGAASRNYVQYWVPTQSWSQEGSLVLGGTTLTTFGKNSISIPFELNADGEYEVFIRVGYTQSRGNLAIHMDGFPLDAIRPYADSWETLKWTNVGSLYLEKGRHTIFLTNDGTGWNDVDAVAVVRSSVLEQQIKEVAGKLENYSGRIIYLMSSAHVFAGHLPPEWRLVQIPYQGEMLEAISSSTLYARVLVPREGWYGIAARVAYGPEFGNMTVRFNGFSATVSCNCTSEGFRWVELGKSGFLTSSNMAIFVDSAGRIKFDQLAFYSVTGTDDTTTLNQIFAAEQSAPSISWNRVDESRYVARVRTDKSFFLIFSEAYHLLWRAFVNDQEICPIVAYSVVNGFFINKTGEFDVTIYFTGQTYADIGLKVSATTLVATAIYLVAYPSLYRKLRNKLRMVRPGKAKT